MLILSRLVVAQPLVSFLRTRAELSSPFSPQTISHFRISHLSMTSRVQRSDFIGQTGQDLIADLLTHVLRILNSTNFNRNSIKLYYSKTRRCLRGLLKICHLAEFTLAVESVLAIIIFIAKWLIEHTGNLTGPWASFQSVRTKLRIKCNSKLNKSLLRLLWAVFVPWPLSWWTYGSAGPQIALQHWACSSSWPSLCFHFQKSRQLKWWCCRLPTSFCAIHTGPTPAGHRLPCCISIHSPLPHHSPPHPVWRSWQSQQPL